MFAWYSLPKTYAVFKPKPGKPTQEERFYMGFVLTHDRAYRELPAFSDAMTAVRPKRFFDATTGMKSTYMAVLYSLLGGKKSYEEIEAMADDELPDFDDLIGRPVTLFIDSNKEPDSNGIYGRRVTSIEPADTELIKSIKPLYAERKTEVTDKGVTRLVSPAAQYEDDAPASAAPAIDYGILDDEIPF
jgi:hypothetical protein